jgi:hypothetical protein
VIGLAAGGAAGVLSGVAFGAAAWTNPSRSSSTYRAFSDTSTVSFAAGAALYASAAVVYFTTPKLPKVVLGPTGISVAGHF